MHEWDQHAQQPDTANSMMHWHNHYVSHSMLMPTNPTMATRSEYVVLQAYHPQFPRAQKKIVLSQSHLPSYNPQPSDKLRK
jgi:hypothetical protein